MFSLWKLCLHYYPVGDDWFPSFPSESQVPPPKKKKIHPIARPPPRDISWMVPKRTLTSSITLPSLGNWSI